jgi:DNA-binding transcriptional MerR regulator
MRIDELARKARTTTRNVRAYTTRGLMPPPEMKGRVGHYGEAHLGRLRLIARLADRGFSLAAIQEVVRAWEQKQDLKDLLGLESAVTTPWVGDERVIDLKELAKLAPGLAASPALIARAVKLEVLAKAPGGYRLLNERLLRVGRELGDAGLPAAAVLETLPYLRAAVEPIAAMFVELFRRELWAPFMKSGAPSEKLQQLTEQLERVRPIAGQAVEAVLSQVMDRAIAETAARELAVLGTTSTRGAKR